MGEVVRLDARQGEREPAVIGFEWRTRRRIECGTCRLVAAPGSRGRAVVVGIAVGEAAIVVAQKVAAFGRRQVLGEVAPRLGKNRTHAVEKPLDLGSCAQEDAAQDEAGHPFGMP